MADRGLKPTATFGGRSATLSDELELIRNILWFWKKRLYFNPDHLSQPTDSLAALPQCRSRLLGGGFLARMCDLVPQFLHFDDPRLPSSLRDESFLCHRPP